MTQCKYCQKELPPAKPGGHRAKEYCNDACKQADYRKRQAQGDQAESSPQELEMAMKRIEDLEQENIRLRSLLDIEHRYHQDTQVRGFKFWLKKQPASTLHQKLLADQFLPVRGSRGLYEAYLRKAQYSTDERHEFVHLWKSMLLQS